MRLQLGGEPCSFDWILRGHSGVTNRLSWLDHSRATPSSSPRGKVILTEKRRLRIAASECLHLPRRANGESAIWSRDALALKGQGG